MKEQSITFLQPKTRYEILKKENKEQELFVIESILNQKDSKTFWTIINQFRKKTKPNQCPIYIGMFMLHKKGDKENTINDPAIALLNKSLPVTRMYFL